MPRHLLPLLLLISLSCKGEQPTPLPSPTDAPAEPAADAKADVKEEAPAAPKERVKAAPPTAEQIRAAAKERHKHITEGRKLAKTKQFAQAAAEFEEAVKLDPYDARALSELGWVAFQAGELERAEEATRTSLRFTYDPKVRGATLYNLGRIHEARAQLPEAALAYANSLAVRANDTVSKRLDALKAQGITPPAVAEQRCGFKRQEAATPEAVCKALASGAGLRCDDSDIKTWKLEDAHISEAALVAIEREEEWTADYYLLVKIDGVWQSDQLGYAYNPGAFGVSEEFEVKTLELRALLPGGVKALYIEAVHNHYDSDMGVNEFSVEDHTFTYVVGMRGEAVDWLLGLATKLSWSRDILMDDEEEAMKAAGIEHDTKLPVGETFEATLTFAPETGSVTVGKAADKALPRSAELGEFKLLEDAPRCPSL
jgi:tetratricopeptide (TPR) repeat protein